MRKLILLSLLALGVCSAAMAQQEAVTRDGKVVILFENGTWKYADLPMADPEKEIPNRKEIAVNTPVSIKNIRLDRQVVIECESPKLKKYFKTKNIVRTEFSLEGKEGKAVLKMDWKIQTPEAFAYFGFIKPGNKLSLELLNGKTIDLVFTQEFEPKEFEKYGFSTYQSQVELSPEQVNLLQTGIVKKAVMAWARRSEEYSVKNPAYFINELPKILE